MTSPFQLIHSLIPCPPQPSNPPSAAASTAAVQAFLANRASNVSLSNAAASAALRSYTTSPAPVSEIRTKRMALRRGSVSSNGSATSSPLRPGSLRRRTSSGSMTERTFREPSPNHGVSPSLQPQHPPPVPALPRDYASPPPVPVKSTRRAASSEPPEPPPTTRAAGRGASLDRGPGVMQSRQYKGSKYRISSLVNVGRDRVQTRDSINFSRPMSPQNSPATSPLIERPTRSLPNPSSLTSALPTHFRTSGLRDGERESIQSSIAATADRPVKMKKKAVAKEIAEGSHLANAASGGRPSVSALSTTLPPQPDPRFNTLLPLNSRPQNSNLDDPQNIVASKKKGRNIPPSGNQTEEGEKARHYYASDSDTQSERSFSDRPRVFNTRVAGLLVKQPSIVREEPEAEEHEELEPSPGHKNDQSLEIVGADESVSTASRAIKVHQPDTKSARQSAKAISLGVPAANHITGIDKGLLNVTVPGHQSLSPARAAHFSSQPILEMPEGAKHQPPLRSVSPAKSALKHSPSSRGPSPGSWARTNGRAPSENSDTTSAISDDGFKGATRGKKRVRVSFDEESVVVGRAASPPTSPDSPIIMSPQNKESSGRGWSTSSRDRKEHVGGFTDMDSKIKPTPALPSFGSVRECKYEGIHDQTTISRSNQHQLQPAPHRYETSGDLAIGDVIAQHYKSKGGLDDPIPPELTSMEGIGYHSDSGNSFNSNEANHQPSGANAKLTDTDSSSHAPALPADTNRGTRSLTSGGPIPSITILPATPGIDSPGTERQDWLRIPGQFPLSTESLAQDLPSGTSAAEQHVTSQTPAEIGIAEPGPVPATTPHEFGPPPVGSVSDGLRAQIRSQAADEESEESGESIYSDAAEDLSDSEGDGFGSINAIVEGPDVIETLTDTPSQEAAMNTKVQPLVLGKTETGLSRPAFDEGWDRSQAYWSGLNNTRRQRLEEAAVPGAIDDGPIKPMAKLRTNSSMQNETLKSPGSAYPKLPTLAIKKNRDGMSSPVSPKPSAMKQSMRSSRPASSKEHHMPSSMRTAATSNSQRNLAQPSDAPQLRGALQKKARPVSAVALVDYSKPPTKAAASCGRSAEGGVGSRAMTPVHFSPPTSQRRKLATTKLHRVNSTGSDSSSSFKRLRPATADNNRYTMKRSMRPGSTDDQSQSLAGNRISTYSARSTSPNEPTRRPFSSAGSAMRTSMRGPIDSGKKTRSKSPARFGFAKPAKSKKATTAKSGFSSRFADSSDEDARPVNRRSRFEDSSDDDVPSRLTPVRGIPRRIDEGDSTDLEDSSAEPSPMGNSKANNRTASKVQNLQGLTLVTGSLLSTSNSVSTPAPRTHDSDTKFTPQKDKKKRSFFGSLGAKKRDDSRGSPARKGAPLERPKTARIFTVDSQDLAVSGAAASAKPPKLHRRATPKRFVSDSWPLPDISTTADIRPHTSDGNGVVLNENGSAQVNGVSALPDSATMGTALQSGGLAGSNVVAVKSRRKRFPRLRKALRLKD